MSNDLVANVDVNPWLSVGDAAIYAALSTDTIYTACERAELRHVKVGGRKAIRIRAAWINEWLEHHASGGVKNEPVKLTAPS